jgi:hypothetical protein
MYRLGFLEGFLQIRASLFHFVTFQDEEILTPRSNTSWRTTHFGCPRLLIQYVRGYPPYLEAIPPTATCGRAMPCWLVLSYHWYKSCTGICLQYLNISVVGKLVEFDMQVTRCVITECREVFGSNKMDHDLEHMIFIIQNNKCCRYFVAFDVFIILLDIIILFHRGHLTTSWAR